SPGPPARSAGAERKPAPLPAEKTPGGVPCCGGSALPSPPCAGNRSSHLHQRGELRQNEGQVLRPPVALLLVDQAVGVAGVKLAGAQDPEEQLQRVAEPPRRAVRRVHLGEERVRDVDVE